MLAALDPRPWVVGMLASAVLGVTSFVGGCMHGEQLAAGQTAQRDQRAQQADIRRIDNAIDAAMKASAASENAKTRVVTRFKPIEREVIRYVQSPAAAEQCLDADGLRIWSAANRGEFETTRTERAGHDAVPGGDSASGEWLAGRRAGESRRDGESLAAVRGETFGPDQLRRTGSESPGGSE